MPIRISYWRLPQMTIQPFHWINVLFPWAHRNYPAPPVCSEVVCAALDISWCWKYLSGADATTPPVALQGVATSLSRLFPVSQECRSCTPQRALSQSIPDPPVAHTLALGKRGGAVLPPVRGVAGSLDLRNPVAL